MKRLFPLTLAMGFLVALAPSALLAGEPILAAPTPVEAPALSIRPESDAGPSSDAIFSLINDACHCCADACQSCADHCGGFMGGVGVYLVQPYFETNPAYSVFVQETGPGQRFDITQHMQVAPLIWLGYMGDNGTGVRARWWYFREDTSQSVTFPTGGPEFTVFGASAMGAQLISDNPSGYAVTSKLQLQVADLEVVKNATVGCWDFLFSGGVRYADLSQNYNAYAAPATAGPVVSGNSFTGLGPVVAMEARFPLCGCWLSGYGSVRASVLFGSLTQQANGVGTEADTEGDQPPDAGNVVNTGHHDQVISADELELGVEVHSRFNRGTVFGQIAFVGQEWFGAGNATRSAFSNPPTGAPVFGTDISSNLGFFGLSVRLGVNY